MATVDYTGGTSVGTAIPYDFLNNHLTIRKGVVDTAESGITNTDADVYQAIDIPANTHVYAAWFEVVTAESTNVTATFQLGVTDGDTDGFVTAAPCAAEAVHPFNGANIAAGGLAFTTADTLDLLVATAAFTDCKVIVYALCLDMN